jgi:hypothetical protein
MNKSHYTKDGRHPEDVIYQERQFIREINSIVNSKFEKLVKDLRLDEAGADWLFDYIYNCDDETISFDEFLNEAGLEYADFVKIKVGSNHYLNSYWYHNE